MKEQIYKVEGMHCASCEILIEKKLLEIPGIKSADASTGRGQVVIEFEGDKPNLKQINGIFEKDNYKFYENQPIQQTAKNHEPKNVNSTLFAFNIAIFIVIAFLILQATGIANFFNLSSTSSLMAFIGLGLLAGISSCAALVGGIVLSMSKQWNNLYAENSSTTKKLQPHIMFNFGRIISYAIFGAILGMVGAKLQISLQFTAFLIVAISLLMIAIGLQMLGVKSFQKFQFSAPKGATRYIANENNFQGKYMPFLMGAATFILPCGFTVTAQSMALLSGNAISGALIMAAFVLGTAPSLLFIGLSSIKFSSKPHLAERFSKVAGFLLLFFAAFNISNQMNVLGFTGFDFTQNQQQVSTVDEKDLPPIIDGKQVIKMVAYAGKDVPNYFKVRVGIPVRWEITADKSAGGCNSSIISAGLFSGSIPLIPGEVSIKEFTPQKAGKYKFSCQMGMITGIIEAIDMNSTKNNSNKNIAVAAESPKNSNGASSCKMAGGSSGCGCGGGAKIKKDATPTSAQIKDDYQIIKTTYTAKDYLKPNSFKVKAGQKVKFLIDIKDSGRGCGGQIMIPGLYDNAQSLIAGNQITMEFTPTSPGTYNITCGMNMINFGAIIVE